MASKKQNTSARPNVNRRGAVLHPGAVVVVPTEHAADVDLEPDWERPDLVAAAKAGHLSVDTDGSITPVAGYTGTLPETTGDMLAVYRAVGLPMATVSELLRRRALALGRILTLVGSADSAPAEFVELADRMVAHWLFGALASVEPWMVHLEAVIAVMGPLARGQDPTKLATRVLESLAATTEQELPKHLQLPPQDAGRLRAAGRSLLAVKVVSGQAGGRVPGSRTSDNRPADDLRKARTDRKGDRLSAWGAARVFAEQLGVYMPERKTASRKKTRR